MGSWEDLDSKAGEKPGRVGRNIGRLIGPIIELVVAEEADIRQEDTGIDIYAVQSIEVVAGVGFREIAVRVVQIPLPACWAGVVARGSLGIQTKLRHDSCAHIV